MKISLTHPLHLFRALLRECTYLPDPQARLYMHRYVVWSYRNYLPKIHAFRREIPHNRQVSLLHRGRKTLTILRKANDGYAKALGKVLMMTYGRTGKRRRELMEPLLRPEVPQNHHDVMELKAPRLYTEKWKPPHVLAALLHSQAKAKGLLDHSIRGARNLPISPKIPKKSIWGKPLHPKRAKNMTKKWYARVADRLLPPLAEEEWKELRSLATGEVMWNGPVPRRAITSNEAEESPRMSGKAFIEVPQKGHTFRPYVNGSPHVITQRYMRNLWRAIFEQVPKRTWDAKNETWRFQWNRVRAPRLFTLYASTNYVAPLFDDTTASSPPEVHG